MLQALGGPAIPYLFDWHRHSHSHHSSGDADFDSAFVSILAALALLCAFGLGFVLAGLLQGGLWLFVVGKKRHLFWAVPTANGVLYFPARAYLLPETGPLTAALLGVPLAVLCGLFAAALLAPFAPTRRSADGPSVEADVAALLDPLPAGEPWWPAFRRGLAAPWEGFGYLSRRPGLWRYALLPVLLNLLITGGMLLLLVLMAAAFAAYLHPLFPPGWGWVALEVLCAVVLLLLAFGLALVVWALLQGVLCGHYYTKLARAVELRLGLPSDQMVEVTWGYQIADACRDVALLVAVNGGFLLLHVVPVVGSLVAVAGSLYFDWLLFGEEFFDYPLALRGRRRREKEEFTRRHRFQTLGLGAVAFLASFVPVAGAVLLASAVVGAVLLHRRLQVVPAVVGSESVT
jgi:CysZ protein